MDSNNKHYICKHSFILTFIIFQVSLASKLQKDLSYEIAKFEDSEKSIERNNMQFQSKYIGSEDDNGDASAEKYLAHNSKNINNFVNSSKAFIAIIES